MAQTNETPSREELLQKIKKLETQVEGYKESQKRANKNKLFLAEKVGSFLILGPALKKNVKRLLEGDISKDNTADILVNVLYRFTRIGIFAFLIAIVPIGILIIQTILLDRQNDRLSIQNGLIEADRRSSLVFLMSNVMDKVDDEIRHQRPVSFSQRRDEKDSTKYFLSEPLIGRIVALSRAFKPYKVMQGDKLSEKLQSLERGQLFISLMKSNLDSISQNTIVDEGDFSYAIIGRINLRGSKLMYAELKGADLKTAYLRETNLYMANLIEADLRKAYLVEANLRKANLLKANMKGTDLRETDFKDAYLIDADMRFTRLEGAKNLTYEQLLSVKNLSGCLGVDPEVRVKLKKEKPCLFTEEGCPSQREN